MTVKLRLIKNNFTWFLLILFTWMPCFAYTIGKFIFVTIGIYGTIFLLLIYYIKTLGKRWTISKSSFKFVIVILFFMIYAVMKQKYMLEDGMRDSIYLGIIFLIFSLVLDAKMTKDMLHILYFIPGILSLIMAIFALFPGSYDLNSFNNALYLHFQNPNILSFVLLNIIIFEFLGYLDEKSKYYLISVFITVILLILTHARSSLLASISIFGAFLLRVKKYEIKTWISILTPLIPLLFVLLYISTSTYVLNISLYGKTGLSGRNIIWMHIVNSLKENNLFFWLGKGKYMKNYMLSAYDNAHNAYMQFICDFGFPVFIIILFSIMTLSRKAAKKVMDKYTLFAYAGTVAIFLNCSFETHIADAIIGLTFLWLVLYWIILSRGEKNDFNGKTYQNKRIT